MSNATVPVPIPQADFHAAASAALPWYAASSPEQQALLFTDYGKAYDIPLAEYLKDVSDWPSMVEYLTDAGLVEEAVPSKAQDIWPKYAAAVDKYSRSEAERQLDVGKWAHAYILAYVGSETDAAVRRSRRSAAVTRCQDYITDTCTSGVPVTVDRALRLYAVAQVFGKAEAKQLGIGKLRAFESATYRDRETEAWGFKDSVTEEQQTTLRDLWARAVAGTVTCSAAELQAEVNKAMGKEVSQPAEKPAEPTETKEEAKTPTETAGTRPEANTTVSERVPEVAPENPVECAKRMANLPYGRPDSELVWRNFGSHVSLSEKDAAAFVQGLADAGRLQVLTMLAKSSVESAKRLASAPKTVEAARAVA